MARRSQRTTLLTAAIAGTIATTLSLQAWTLVEGRERALRGVEVRAANRAQATLDGVRSVIARIDLELLAIRDHLDPEALLDPRGPQATTRSALNALLHAHVERVSQLARIHVVAADGRFAYSSVTPTPAISVADRAYLQEQRAATADELRLSELYLSRLSGAWSIYATRRITTRDGRFAGIVLAAIDARTLDRELKAVDQARWTLALLDRDHRLIGSAPPIPEQIGAPFQEAVVRSAGTAGQARSRGGGLGSERPAVWAAQHDARLGLTTVAGYAQALALAQWRRDLGINLVVAALLVAASAGALVFHGRHLRSADSVRSLHERLALAATEVHLGVWEWDPPSDAVQWDEAMAELHRQAPVQRWTLGSWLETIAPAERARLAEALDGARRTPGRFEVQVLLNGEPERHLRIAGVAAEEGPAADQRVYGIAWDVTAVERAHQALTQAQKLDALGHLAGGVAHDFNNMLAAILSAATLLTEELEDPGQRELAGTIQTAATRAAELTQKLLAFGRKGKVVSRPVDVHALVRETCAILARTIDKRITVSTALEAPRATVLGDPAQLQSALLNLGVNARDAMPEGGQIRFATAVRRLRGADRRQGAFELEEGDHLLLTVADDGAGIGEDVLPHIFDPYFTTKAQGKGTGLGLAAVYGTVAAHRGAVTVSSTSGAGACFTLFLPLCDALRGDAPPPSPRPPRATPGKVLVVDDEEVVRTSTAAVLRALGNEPVLAAGPSEALELFRLHRQAIDAVLVDMVLATRTGLDLAAQLRSEDPTIPIVLMSGFLRSEPLGDLSQRGLSGFLQKPFTRSDLERVLEAVRGGRGAGV